VFDQDGHILSDRPAVELVVLVMDDLVDAAPFDFREALRKPLDDLLDGFVLRRWIFIHLLSLNWRYRRVNIGMRLQREKRPVGQRRSRLTTRCAASGHRRCVRGNRISKVVPDGVVSASRMVPPCLVVMSRTRARPIPKLRRVGGATGDGELCANRSKM
jgi:hypothetical protein